MSSKRQEQKAKQLAKKAEVFAEKRRKKLLVKKAKDLKNRLSKHIHTIESGGQGNEKYVIVYARRLDGSNVNLMNLDEDAVLLDLATILNYSVEIVNG